MCGHQRAGGLRRVALHLHLGYGHAPEHMALHCEARNILISGDMVLPRISTNVSVYEMEPEADALTIHGEVCVVGQQEPGGPWELAASGRTLPPETWTTARGAYRRIRQYARGGRCTRDSADEAAS